MRRQEFSDQRFTAAAAVDISGVEEINAPIDSRRHNRQRLRIGHRPEIATKLPTTKSNFADWLTVCSKGSVFHKRSVANVTNNQLVIGQRVSQASKTVLSCCITQCSEAIIPQFLRYCPQ